MRTSLSVETSTAVTHHHHEDLRRSDHPRHLPRRLRADFRQGNLPDDQGRVLRRRERPPRRHDRDDGVGLDGQDGEEVLRADDRVGLVRPADGLRVARRPREGVRGHVGLHGLRLPPERPVRRPRLRREEGRRRLQPRHQRRRRGQGPRVPHHQQPDPLHVHLRRQGQGHEVGRPLGPERPVARRLRHQALVRGALRRIIPAAPPRSTRDLPA
mmetsp:Transcript_25014/g.82934  ORF Transcript_25014/g.82934 Transcript_25014/m.82934 type:complete len:213 (+) Transcript_25014:3-641(+)